MVAKEFIKNLELSKLPLRASQTEMSLKKDKGRYESETNLDEKIKMENNNNDYEELVVHKDMFSRNFRPKT